jgi:(E)-4-hydroxy-3-methylbut-2-enyl-diphosphate synthase
MKVAVMGCIVNGPVKASMPTSASACQARARRLRRPVYIDGEKALTLRGDNIANEFHQLVENYIEKRFGQRTRLTESA